MLASWLTDHRPLLRRLALRRLRPRLRPSPGPATANPSVMTPGPSDVADESMTMPAASSATAVGAALHSASS
jgi:hypothetical protein